MSVGGADASQNGFGEWMPRNSVLRSALHTPLWLGDRGARRRTLPGGSVHGHGNRDHQLLVSAPRRTGDGYYEAVVRMADDTLIEIVA